MGFWSALSLPQRILAILATWALIGLAIYFYGLKRYHDGLVHERTAHATELARINALGEANERANRLKETSWAKSFQELENRYAQLEADSRQARLDRDVRERNLVQNLASCRIRELREAPTDPRRIAEAARITQLAGEIGAAIAAVGDAAQRDARRLGLCQDTLAAERQ